jgi:hypothetical protein
MNIDTDRLQRKVDTRNRVNAKANELQAEFAKLLLSFVGKKVIKETPYRSWTKRVVEVIEVLTSGAGYLDGCCLVFDFYDYNVWGTLTCTYRVSESTVEYVKRDFLVCTLNGDLLHGCSEAANPARTDYTVDEVIAKFTELEELEAKVNEVKSQLLEFRK